MTETETTPKIYVACLAAYNAGKLHGRWIELSDKDTEEVQEEIAKLLKRSPEPNAEEYAIHDHEGFPPGAVGEYSSISEVMRIVALMQQHGDAFRAALAYWCDVDDAEKAVTDAYAGAYDSLVDYAQEFAEETDAIPEQLRGYIDWAKYARDLEMTAIRYGNSVHLFHQW